jgi:hypothetical protein
MISWDYPFIYNDSLFRLSLLVYVADKYVNDQIHLYHDPSSFSLPLYAALKYATGLFINERRGVESEMSSYLKRYKPIKQMI